MRKFLKVGMDEEFYNQIQHNANNLDITLSEYCRKLLRDGKVVYEDKNSNIAKIYHLNKIGNNINQIARFTNANKKLDIQIYNLLIEVKDYLEELSNGDNGK